MRKVVGLPRRLTAAPLGGFRALPSGQRQIFMPPHALRGESCVSPGRSKHRSGEPAPPVFPSTSPHRRLLLWSHQQRFAAACARAHQVIRLPTAAAHQYSPSRDATQVPTPRPHPRCLPQPQLRQVTDGSVQATGAKPRPLRTLLARSRPRLRTRRTRDTDISTHRLAGTRPRNKAQPIAHRLGERITEAQRHHRRRQRR